MNCLCNSRGIGQCGFLNNQNLKDTYLALRKGDRNVLGVHIVCQISTKLFELTPDSRVGQKSSTVDQSHALLCCNFILGTKYAGAFQQHCPIGNDRHENGTANKHTIPMKMKIVYFHTYYKQAEQQYVQGMTQQFSPRLTSLCTTSYLDCPLFKWKNCIMELMTAKVEPLSLLKIFHDMLSSKTQ